MGFLGFYNDIIDPVARGLPTFVNDVVTFLGLTATEVFARFGIALPAWVAPLADLSILAILLGGGVGFFLLATIVKWVIGIIT